MVDIYDNCPGVENPDQSDGDGDGIGDACDMDPDDGCEWTKVEYPIWGIAREGTAYDPFDWSEVPPDSIYSRDLERKVYELTDHLGNARVVLKDWKQSTGTVGRRPYEASIGQYSNIYPFGMEQPGRSWSGGAPYRYGYNGMETSPETGGENYTTYFRQYDARIGRWMSTDPVTHEWESPYAAMGNNPIVASDPMGDSAKGPNPLNPTKPSAASSAASIGAGANTGISPTSWNDSWNRVKNPQNRLGENAYLLQNQRSHRTDATSVGGAVRVYRDEPEHVQQARATQRNIARLQYRNSLDIIYNDESSWWERNVSDPTYMALMDPDPLTPQGRLARGLGIVAFEPFNDAYIAGRDFTHQTNPNFVVRDLGSVPVSPAGVEAAYTSTGVNVAALGLAKVGTSFFRPAVTTTTAVEVSINTEVQAAKSILNPNEISFMQSSIKNTTGEYTVLGNAEALRAGTLDPQVLTMRVWTDASGKTWTLDHRRLAAFRLSGLQDAPVQWADPAGEMWKMTTTNGGTSIKLKLGGGQSIIVK